MRSFVSILLISITLILSVVIADVVAQIQQQTSATRSRPDFTDMSVGLLITNGAKRLTEENWFDKVQGPISYFIQNALTDTLRAPMPEGAFSTPETSVPVAWTCDARIRAAWERTNKVAPAVTAAFMDAMAVYAQVARSSPIAVDCQIIGLQSPLMYDATSAKHYTNVVVERIPIEQPSVVRITLSYE